MTERALADPRRFISADPLADAWGMEHGALSSVATLEQTVPARDMLYLDKAWPHLQSLTATGDASAPRPAFRMFEGDVTMHGFGWTPWVRVVTPSEVAEIARDLDSIVDHEAEQTLRALARFGRGGSEEADYATPYLRRAREFMSGLVAEGRGMVYMIG